MIKIIDNKILIIEMPKGYRNIAVTLSNHLVADTNDSTNWDTLKFPLPKGKWSIYSTITKKDKATIILQDNRNLIQRFLKI